MTDFYITALPLTGLIYRINSWISDLLLEGDAGFHTTFVIKTYRDCVGIFIFREAIIFFSFFWAFLHSAISPSCNLDILWPPLGVRCPNPFSTALFSTNLLIASRFLCMLCHRSIKLGDYDYYPLLSLFLAIVCGSIFLVVQAYEYYKNSFCIADRVFGSCFYLLTGFHGFHVLLGVLWLSVSWLRLYFGHFSKMRHHGMRISFWYWHFVDVVWIFVWLLFYLWYGGWAFEKYIEYKGLSHLVVPRD